MKSGDGCRRRKEDVLRLCTKLVFAKVVTEFFFSKSQKNLWEWMEKEVNDGGKDENIYPPTPLPESRGHPVTGPRRKNLWSL
jgi:hypothetical protein